MFGTTHISKRLVTATGIAAAIAALIAPAGLARVDRTGHDFPGASATPMQSDTVNSAKVAHGQANPTVALVQRHDAHEDRVYAASDGYPLDPAIATAIAAHAGRPPFATNRLPRGFETDTVNSARLAPVVQRVASGDFDWSSFGIGIGAGIGGVLGLAALVTRTGRLGRLASA
jgi:hypothetical protein